MSARPRRWETRSTNNSISTALETLRDFSSPELGNRRDVLVYVPASYHRHERSYPVLYMQDGQNLFDPATSYAGDWKLGNVMASAHPLKSDVD